LYRIVLFHIFDILIGKFAHLAWGDTGEWNWGGANRASGSLMRLNGTYFAQGIGTYPTGIGSGTADSGNSKVDIIISIEKGNFTATASYGAGI
jgi:hypothetical protein